MPHNIDKIPLGIYDRRVKLTEVQRNEIKEFRRQGLSYNAIAKLYDVSKRLVIFICNPDIAEKNRIACMERHREGRYKYTKEEWAAVLREHRAYKRKLHKEGKI